MSKKKTISKENEEVLKKASVQAEEMLDQETGSQADVDAIMKKYDRESNTRIWEGTPKLIIRYTFAAFMVFMIFMNLYPTGWSSIIRGAIFLGCLVPFTLIIYPVKKGATKVNHMPWYDIVLAVLGAAAFFYIVIRYNYLLKIGNTLGTPEIVVAIVGILIVAECCRRSVGIPILCVAGFFVFYTLVISGKSFNKTFYSLFYATDVGIFSSPIFVCSTFIVLFLMFGAFLEATGISAFFIDCANTLVGWASGGPAKVAVVSSALCGMVSGSSVGNTVTTGSVTIPMMKKTGYPGEFAGAVEAAASTGGQIMPPIMGAAAFIMADITGLEYPMIVVRAILPAFLYFAGIFLMVHFQAKKMGLKGIDRSELPKARTVLPKIYLLVPLITLMVLIISGMTLALSAIIASGLAILVASINKDNRMTVRKFFDALENGTKNTLSIAMACAIAGIISGCITVTGLAGQLTSLVKNLSGGNLFIALVLTMIACIILGMGVPTTANYVIMASTCAPILENGFGVQKLAAHMFCFYFGIVADITPPVALAAYAGSAIAKSSPMKTALNASRLAIAAFVIPYMFVFNNVLIFLGEYTAFDAIWSVLTACLGMFALSAGLIGYFQGDMNWIVRIIFLAAGLCMIIPENMTDYIGIGLMVVGTLLQILVFHPKKNKSAAA